MHLYRGWKSGLNRLGCFPLLLSTLLIYSLASHNVASAEEVAEETEEVNVCIECHLEMEDILKDVVIGWQKSVHAEAGVLCHDCHGGDPTDYGEAMEPTSGFKPKPELKDIPKFCSKCHSDPAKMRTYNLPHDQFDQFSGSVHGQKLAAGDKKAPTCINCHGSGHDIRRIEDPDAPTNRTNVVKTCAGCHSNKAVMDKRGLPSNQYELYKTSVHGQLYFEGDLGVPTCIDCHSNHGIMKPQNNYTRLICVNCHVEQEEAYKMSLHWDNAIETGSPTCVHCHSNHNIGKPSPAKFVDEGKLNCLGCHKKNSLQMETATTLHKMITSTGDSLAQGNDAVKVLHDWSGSGFQTSHLSNKLKKVEKILGEITTGSHSLDVSSFTKKAQTAETLATEVITEVEDRKKELTSRKWGLLVSWVVFFTFSYALYRRSSLCSRD